MPRRRQSDSALLAQLIRHRQQLNSPQGLNGTTDQARNDLAEAVLRGLDLAEFAQLVEALEPTITGDEAAAAVVDVSAAEVPDPAAPAPADPAELPTAEAGTPEAPDPYAERKAKRLAKQEAAKAAMAAEREATRAANAAMRLRTEERRQARAARAATAPAGAAAAAAPPAKAAKAPRAKKAEPAAAAAAPPAAEPRPVLVGKPLELPRSIRMQEHPTVRFLAAREATDPGAGTLLVCGNAPALAAFDDHGELLLVPLSEQVKKGQAPCWGDNSIPLDRLSVDLLGPSGGITKTTEQTLAWIDQHTRKVKTPRKGSFYYSSAQAVDPVTLQTTMGAVTARGLSELFLEWDHLTFEQQERKVQWLESLGFSVTLVHSGSKSIHCHIHFDRVVPFDEALPLLKLLCALGDGDSCVVSKGRAMRLAGAYRPSTERLRGGQQYKEQSLLKLADRCYEPLEVQRTLEAEATARGWLLDHLAARWSAYRKALGQKPETWNTATEAWTRPAIEATAWAKRYRSSDGHPHSEPVDWRKEETEIGAKIRRAEAALLERHGLADAYELVAVSGRLEELQVAKGFRPGQFEFGFSEEGDKIKGQSPWSQWRAGGNYSGNSLHLFTESQAFFCWASDRKGKLAEFAAHFCRYPVLDPEAPTDEEQLKIALYLWELAELPAEEFECEGSDNSEGDNASRIAALENYQNARSHRLKLSEVLHPAIAALLNERAEAFPVSEVAMLPPFLAAAASIMGVRYRVRVKGGWEEPMVFWIGAVGPASTLKTPVAQQCLRPLLDRDYWEQKNYTRLLNAWKAIPREDRDGIDPPPTPRKRVAGDATLEGLCAALDTGRNPGMVSYHDELVTFIASMDAYRGRGGQSKDRGHWLSMWSGQEINILRKGHDPIFIPRTCVNLFGCVQQDKLTELLQGDDASAKSGDGFWARFLWCVPCNPFPKMNWDESDITDQLRQVYTTLDDIAGKLTVTLDGEAREVFAAQADKWSLEAEQTDPARCAFLGKMRGYSVRFAGFLHALDHAMNNLVPPPKEGEEPKETGVMNTINPLVPASVMRRALKLSEFFIAQFDTLAPQVGGGDLPSWVVKVVELGERDGTVTARDLVRRKWAASAKEAREMLLTLVQRYEKGRLLPSPRKDALVWTPTDLTDTAAAA